jgi:hypothetical protein
MSPEEARSQKPEARSQKPEARSQKPEARSQKPKQETQTLHEPAVYLATGSKRSQALPNALRRVC